MSEWEGGGQRETAAGGWRWNRGGRTPNLEPRTLNLERGTGVADKPKLGSATALRLRTPRPQAWDESSDMPTIFPIGLTKSSLQLQLLDKRNVDEIEHQEAACPDAMGRRPQHEGLTGQKQNS